jgi:hypothetical protein
LVLIINFNLLLENFTGPNPKPSTSDAESGECINGWVCEHRWPGIKNLGMLEGAMRKAPGYENWWDNDASKAML